MKALINLFVLFFVLSFSLIAQTFIQVGADPQDLHRKVHPDEMLIKYFKNIYVRTQSGSGKDVRGILRKGEPLIVKKEDFEKGDIRNFVILQCGNETSVYARRGVSSLQTLDMNNIEVVWANEDSQSQQDTVYVPAGGFDNYNYNPPPYQPYQKVESADNNTVWYILGGIAIAVLVYAVIENNNKGVVVNNYTGGTGGGTGGGGGPVNPPNGPVNPANGKTPPIPRGIVAGISFGF